jgi:hypothetical protein
MKEDKVIKKEVIVKEGGQMNQSITTVVEQPSSVEIGPIKVQDSNIGIAVIVAIIIAAGAYIVWRKVKKGK